MSRFSHWTLLGLSAVALSACSAPPPPPPAPPPAATEPGTRVDQLRRLVERYWDENSALSGPVPWGPGGNIAPQAVADSLALEKRYLDEVAAIPRTALDDASALTYDIFKEERLLAVEGFTYPAELLPVNPYEGVPQQYASMAAGAQRLALSGGREFAIWRNGAESFAQWSRQAMANMRDGVRRGYTLPRPLVEMLLPQFAALGADEDTNAFYRAVPAASATSPLAESMRTIIAAKILPQYRALHDFLQQEYLPRARTDAALSALPLGSAWYAHLVRRNAGDASTPAQLHALGLAEMERLHLRMQGLLSEAAFPGNAKAFLDHLRHDSRYAYNDAAALLDAYRDLKAQVAQAAPAVVSSLPQADFSIRSVEPYREAVAAPLSYWPRPANGLTGAILYVNTAHLDLRPAVDIIAQYLREAVPGHHYQLEMQHERTDLPRFRRFSVLPAFVDGWALYAATLGEELGLYHDAQARFGALLAQTRCAAGLVVDTGLHAQGWSRQRALDYLREQVPMDGDDADRIVGRMLALPAEALACSGFLKIQALRVRAQQVLGARFELSAFHQAVAGDGAMPLDLLEPKVRAWIEAAASAPAAPSPAGPPAGAPGGNPAEPERSGAAGDASMPTARR